MLLSSPVMLQSSHDSHLRLTNDKGRMHTATFPKDDKSKSFSHHQSNATHTAVSVKSKAKSTKVRHNLKNFWPCNHVSASLFKSVSDSVQQEWDTHAVLSLNFCGLLSRVSPTLKEHTAQHDSNTTIQMTVSLEFAPEAWQKALHWVWSRKWFVFVAQSNPYMFLNLGWALQVLQLQVDTTFKLSNWDSKHIYTTPTFSRISKSLLFIICDHHSG